MAGHDHEDIDNMFDTDTDLQTQSLLLAAANHDLAALRDLLRNGSANVQDEETGFTPLHAAVAAFEPDEAEGAAAAEAATNGGNDNSNNNSNSNDPDSSYPIAGTANGAQDVDLAAQTIKLLFQHGAIWNDLDQNNETAGCIAHRLGLEELYGLIVDAGVRAELLLGKMAEYQLLGDADDDEEEEEEEEEDEEEEVVDEEGVGASGEESDETGQKSDGIRVQTDIKINVDGVVTDVTAGRKQSRKAGDGIHVQTDINLVPDDVSANNNTYLSSGVSFSAGRLTDASANGVMMAWETDIMKRSADLLIPSRDPSRLRVLNIGHGMGIIDSHIQAAHAPTAHHIIEAHADVLKRMRDQGWYSDDHDDDSEEDADIDTDDNNEKKTKQQQQPQQKPGVVVHTGRWQDIVPKLLEQNELFDAIYFDTFAEEYKALKEFFTEYVIGLLDPQGGKDGQGGRFGFFNGMGADRQVCYDVYGKIVEMDLFEAGFDTEWEDISVPDLQEAGEWAGLQRPYWALKTYRLPTCRFID